MAYIQAVHPLSIKRLTVERFRAFKSPVVLDDLAAVNVIAGPNNVGKSSLLMPLRRLTRMDQNLVPRIPVRDGAGAYGASHSARFKTGDMRRGEPGPKIALSVAGREVGEIVLRQMSGDARVAVASRFATLENAMIEFGSNGSLIDFKLSETTISEIKSRLDGSSVMPVFQHDDYKRLAMDIAGHLASRIVYVPGFRVVGDSPIAPDLSKHEERIYDGAALLADLLRWHLPAPETGGPVAGSPAAALNTGLSDLFGIPVSVWPTPHQRTMIRVGRDAPRYLEDLGQGVSQLVIFLAAGLATRQPPIMILEEPEVCLHPGLQRRLIQFLSRQAGQYFVTTHSNHVLDACGADTSISLVTCVSDSDERQLVPIQADELLALQELGVTASSIAVASSVIWVEGPSDAMYVRFWLSKHERGKSLQEGRDFTFAFHGGSVLAHVGLAEDSVVKLLRIHPAFYLIADSDRRSAAGPLGHSYLQQLVEDPTFPIARTWITEPKEIEGYVPDAAFAPDNGGRTATSTFVLLRDRLRALGLSPPQDLKKVPLALDAIRSLEDWTFTELGQIHDLRQRVEELIEFIELSRGRIPALVPTAADSGA